MSPDDLTKIEKRLEAASGYLMLDMPNHALRELKAISDPEIRSLEFHQLTGEAHRQAERHEEAATAFLLALEKKPNDISLLMALAWCYKRTKQLPKAIAAMEQAYRNNSTEPIVLYNLACYLALAGDRNRALSWLGRAIRMAPDLRKLTKEETDFDQLRDDPGFELITRPPQF